MASYDQGIKLSELLPGLPIVNIFNLQNPTVTGIAYNSTAIKPGFIFVAIKGKKFDGHDYIPEALSNGAAAVVGQDEVFDLDVPYLQVTDDRQALAILSNNYYRNPANELINIGITGTNGKTTTVFMINSILEKAGKKTGLIGTVINKINNKIIPSDLTTPESVDIQKMMREMVREKCRYLSMEVSSQGIALQRVNGIKFNFGVVSNIDLDHTDCHPTFVHYLNTKLKFVEMIEPDNYLLLNADDPYCNEFRYACQSKLITYAAKNEADFKIIELRPTAHGTFFVIRICQEIETRSGAKIKPQIIPVVLNILGIHNIYNALVALIIALLNDIPAKIITKSLAEFRTVPRRCQLVKDGEIRIIDDTALNPHSYDALFSTVKNLYYSNLVIVNSIRGNRGPEINRANARKIAEWVRKLKIPKIIVTSSDFNVGPNDKVTPEEEKAFLKALEETKTRFHFFRDLKEAVRKGISYLQKDDIFLLLGAQGMDDGASIALNLLEKKDNLIAQYV